MTIVCEHNCFAMNVAAVEKPLDDAWFLLLSTLRKPLCGVCEFSGSWIVFTQSQINSLLIKSKYLYYNMNAYILKPSQQ